MYGAGGMYIGGGYDGGKGGGGYGGDRGGHGGGGGACLRTLTMLPSRIPTLL